MKAAVLQAARELVVTDVPEPEIDSQDVLIRVGATGICGSDLHTWRGHHPFRKPPVILGHEVAGEVVAVGEGVTRLKIGDRVAVEPHIYCGVCRYCQQGLVNLCSNKRVPGLGWAGTWAEYFPAPEKVCHRLPDTLSLAEGSMVEPLAVSYRAVRIGDVRMGERVAVLGAGSIGSLQILLLAASGCSRIVATDVSSFHLETASALGATDVVNVRERDVRATALELTDGEGFDCVFVTASHPSSIDEAVRITRKGGRIVVSALYGGPLQFDPNRLVTAEIQLRGAVTYTTPDFADCIRLIDAGVIDARRLITRRLALEQAPEAMLLMDAGNHRAIKMVIEL